MLSTMFTYLLFLCTDLSVICSMLACVFSGTGKGSRNEVIFTSLHIPWGKKSRNETDWPHVVICFWWRCFCLQATRTQRKETAHVKTPRTMRQTWTMKLVSVVGKLKRKSRINKITTVTIFYSQKSKETLWIQVTSVRKRGGGVGGRDSREKESRMNKMTTVTIFCSQKNKETLRIQVTNILNFKWS